MTILPYRKSCESYESREFRIPVCIVTGFLGSGKTTLIHRLPGESHDTRIVVIDNASGQAGIDSSWPVPGNAHIADVNHRLICCTTRGDLAGILGTLARRRDAGAISLTGLSSKRPDSPIPRWPRACFPPIGPSPVTTGSTPSSP